MLIVIAGFPGAFIHAFFSGSLLDRNHLPLDGLGLLGFGKACWNRDYPVVFGTLFIFSLVGLVVNLVSDLAYMWIDPRIDFEAREVWMTLAAPQPIETTTQAPLGEAVLVARRRFAPSPLNLLPLQEILGRQPARLLVVLDLHGAVRGLAVSSPN